MVAGSTTTTTTTSSGSGGAPTGGGGPFAVSTSDDDNLPPFWLWATVLGLLALALLSLSCCALAWAYYLRKNKKVPQEPVEVREEFYQEEKVVGGTDVYQVVEESTVAGEESFDEPIPPPPPPPVVVHQVLPMPGSPAVGQGIGREPGPEYGEDEPVYVNYPRPVPLMAANLDNRSEDGEKQGIEPQASKDGAKDEDKASTQNGSVGGAWERGSEHHTDFGFAPPSYPHLVTSGGLSDVVKAVHHGEPEPATAKPRRSSLKESHFPHLPHHHHDAANPSHERRVSIGEGTGTIPLPHNAHSHAHDHGRERSGSVSSRNSDSHNHHHDKNHHDHHSAYHHASHHHHSHHNHQHPDHETHSHSHSEPHHEHHTVRTTHHSHHHHGHHHEHPEEHAHHKKKRITRTVTHHGHHHHHPAEVREVPVPVPVPAYVPMVVEEYTEQLPATIIEEVIIQPPPEVIEVPPRVAQTRVLAGGVEKRLVRSTCTVTKGGTTQIVSDVPESVVVAQEPAPIVVQPTVYPVQRQVAVEPAPMVVQEPPVVVQEPVVQRQVVEPQVYLQDAAYQVVDDPLFLHEAPTAVQVDSAVNYVDQSSGFLALPQPVPVTAVGGARGEVVYTNEPTYAHEVILPTEQAFGRGLTYVDGVVQPVNSPRALTPIQMVETAGGVLTPVRSLTPISVFEEGYSTGGLTSSRSATPIQYHQQYPVQYQQQQYQQVRSSGGSGLVRSRSGSPVAPLATRYGGEVVQQPAQPSKLERVMARLPHRNHHHHHSHGQNGSQPVFDLPQAGSGRHHGRMRRGSFSSLG